MNDSYWAKPLLNYQVYFGPTSDRIKKVWDKTIGIENVPDCLDWMVIVKPLPCGDAWIQPRYEYNGASSGVLRYVPILHFPKWRHPIATGRHDFRCDLIQRLADCGIIPANEAHTLRKMADQDFRVDIAIGQKGKVTSKFEQIKGYAGVRLGALWKWVKAFGRNY